jgi:Bifunctional DNA primase/polymerase, N-terminal
MEHKAYMIGAVGVKVVSPVTNILPFPSSRIERLRRRLRLYADFLGEQGIVDEINVLGENDDPDEVAWLSTGIRQRLDEVYGRQLKAEGRTVFCGQPMLTPPVFQKRSTGRSESIFLDTAAPSQIRCALLKNGYSPLPLNGKAPSMLKGWQQKFQTNDREIALWSQLWPGATNTGVLTKFVPTLDIDVMDPAAADAIEELAREHFGHRGAAILVRFGQAPKRAILLRTDADEAFDKLLRVFTAPNSSEQKIEVLANGQQVVVHGMHPDTQNPYRWFGGEPWTTPRANLPYVREADVRAFLDEAARVLVEDFGFEDKGNGGRKQTANGHDQPADPAEWGVLTDSIHNGRELHNSLRNLAAKLVTSGMSDGAAVNFLRGLMDKAPVEHDERWNNRRKKIPELVESAREKKQKAETPTPVTPRALTDVITVVNKWLILRDHTPLYAVLGTVAANLLPGDPVWLGFIAPPSSAKTELLNSLSSLPHVRQAATMTPAALLSGTPKRQRDKGAKGGLLREIGDFGIIVMKDFGSLLSVRPDARAELLAALREVYDGAWTRHLGTDGGRTLSWSGKVGLIFGSTEAYDDHYGVVGSLGDRFLLTRLRTSGGGQLKKALDHTGKTVKTMRGELAEVVAGLFAAPRAEPPPLSDEEFERLDDVVGLAVRLRAHVQRDRYSREIESVHGAEGPGRIGLALERVLAGLHSIGLDRKTAMTVIEDMALDSTPPLRRHAFELLSTEPLKTRDIAQAMRLPTTTTRRALEDIAAHGLATRERANGEDGKEKDGGADLWTVGAEWEDWRQRRAGHMKG